MPSRTGFVATPLAEYAAADHDEMPKGWLAYESNTPGVDVIGTSLTTISSIAFTCAADRLIKVLARGSSADLGGDAIDGYCSIYEGGTDLGRVYRHADGATDGYMSGWIIVNGPSAGTHTYLLRGDTSAGDFGFFGAVQLLVEDIGPAS